ncbi:hypothetical protein RKLH11_3340 [Rhodobacteraceae bacterium KLH11]|nr:hypothetical protein RKLH11_3340 [Rhodobacteraceae bacterium KLH11]
MRYLVGITARVPLGVVRPFQTRLAAQTTSGAPLYPRKRGADIYFRAPRPDPDAAASRTSISVDQSSRFDLTLSPRFSFILQRSDEISHRVEQFSTRVRIAPELPDVRQKIMSRNLIERWVLGGQSKYRTTEIVSKIQMRNPGARARGETHIWRGRTPHISHSRYQLPRHDAGGKDGFVSRSGHAVAAAATDRRIFSFLSHRSPLSRETHELFRGTMKPRVSEIARLRLVERHFLARTLKGATPISRQSGTHAELVHEPPGNARHLAHTRRGIPAPEAHRRAVTPSERAFREPVSLTPPVPSPQPQPTPAVPANAHEIDMAKLDTELWKRFEKRIRIEQERRGR